MRPGPQYPKEFSQGENNNNLEAIFLGQKQNNTWHGSGKVAQEDIPCQESCFQTCQPLKGKQRY